MPPTNSQVPRIQLNDDGSITLLVNVYGFEKGTQGRDIRRGNPGQWEPSPCSIAPWKCLNMKTIKACL